MPSILQQLIQSAQYNYDLFWKEPLSPTLVFTALALILVLLLRKQRLAGYVFLLVGIGAIGGSWSQFRMTNYTGWGWWFWGISHLPALVAGVWLLERKR